MAETSLGRDEAPGRGVRAQETPVAAKSADEEAFNELRSLLVGPERRDLRALEAHVNDAALRTREVGRILPEALSVRAHDPQIAASCVYFERGDVIEAGGRLPHEVDDEVHALVHNDELAAGGIAEDEPPRCPIVRERHGSHRQ